MKFEWIDNKTLFACQTILTAVFTVAFLSIRRMYRHLPSTGSFALGFFCAFVGFVLTVFRSGVPDFISVVVLHLFFFTAFVLFYRGILLFFRSPRTTRFLWTSVAVATLLLAYFNTVDNRIVYRIIIISLVIFIARSFIAVELFRQARQRTSLNIFAVLMAIYALFGAGRVIATCLHGPPYDFLETGRFQTAPLIINLVFICIIGLFFLLMLSSELVAIVEAQSLHDHVSGALNRRGIDQRLALELVRAERDGDWLAIALIDIDYFKQINDTAGHAAGDAALKQVAKAISARLRPYDFFGRYGGDEFLLVLPQTSRDDALRVAERMEQAVRGLTVSKLALPVTLSIGLTFATPGETAVSILARADMALYNAKGAGRNCTRIILPSMEEDNSGNMDICPSPDSIHG